VVRVSVCHSVRRLRPAETALLGWRLRECGPKDKGRERSVGKFFLLCSIQMQLFRLIRQMVPRSMRPQLNCFTSRLLVASSRSRNLVKANFCTIQLRCILGPDSDSAVPPMFDAMRVAWKTTPVGYRSQRNAQHRPCGVIGCSAYAYNIRKMSIG